MQSEDRGIRIERGAKRIRAYLRGQLVLDTIEPRLVWEAPRHPHYYVRREDVFAELVATGHTHTSRRLGVSTLWTIRVGKHNERDAAAIYERTDIVELRGLVRVDWNAMDAWFEEDEQVFTHPRNPYTRTDILPTSRHVRAEVDGVVLAESHRAHVVFETGLPPRYYLPKFDARFEYLDHSSTLSYCPYRGEAEYWHVKVGREEYPDAVWSYRRPVAEGLRIAALISFDTSQVDVIVDGIRQA